MKKTLLLLLALGSLTFANKHFIEIRGGYDLSSNTKFKNDIDPEYDSKKFVDNGLHLAAEYRREVFMNLQLGAGFEYRLGEMDQPSNKNRDLENINYSYDSDNITNIPVYVTARYHFKNITGINPYVKANLGYSFNYGEVKTNLNNMDTGKLVEDYKGKVKNGMFYGVGAGIEYLNFIVDLSYDMTNTKISKKVHNYEDNYNENTEHKFDMKKLTLSVGYQFSF